MHQLSIDSFFKKLPQSKANKVLLALSGGKDSMALFHLLKQSEIYFEAAHCNFKLRKEESNQDELFVRNYCEQQGVKIHVAAFDTKNIAASNKTSIQETARALRYEWFNKLLAKHRLDYMATAHHHNDNIETFLINFSRGTGIQGLTGIPVVRDNIIRPISPFTTEEIHAYIRKHAIPYREDSSNSENKYQRNFIRNKIIPLFEENTPEFLNNTKSTLSYLQDAREVCQTKIEEFKAQAVEEKEGDLLISLSKLKQFTPTRFYLHHLLAPFGFSHDNINRLSQPDQLSTGKKFESETHLIYRDRKALVVTSKIHTQIDEQVDSNTTQLKTEFGTIRFKRKEEIEISKNPAICMLDFNKLTFPLRVRTWSFGDRFSPLGMKGEKKISDLFIDEKIPIHEKQRKLILESSNGKIACIIGMRISEDFKITEKTTAVFEIILEE